MPDVRGRHVFISGLTFTVANIKAIGGGAPKYLHDVMLRCMRLDFMPKWTAHASLQDHSLEDLRRLGHPYSTRYGANSFVHPDEYIHEQTGDFLRSVHLEDNGSVIQLVSDSPYYKYLRFGSSVMRIRDPASAALMAALPEMKERIITEIHGAIVNINVR